MRKNISCWIILGFIASLIIPLSAQAADELPLSLKIDLKRLEETWNILDQCAEKIWPGWTHYADVPFHFQYPNGVEMLVGHPDPIDGFVLVPGVEIRGKSVFIDRRRQIALPLNKPLLGGGGVLPFGKTKPVQTVDLKMNFRQETASPSSAALGAGKTSEPAEDELEKASENQLLCNIHELFHCFQREVYQYRFGNLMFNTDANYATYAEIEGLALEKAYLDSDPARAKEYLKDFLAARQLKRRSMERIEQNQESEDELMEGTAVYAETMALEQIKAKYQPKITSGDDPGFGAFRKVQGFLDEKLKALQRDRADSMDSKTKCYHFGCFQALLLTRFFPGWQQQVFKEKKLLDQILKEALNVSPEEQSRIEKRLSQVYPLAEINQKHTRVICQRDGAYDLIKKRQGKAFVVNFKPLQEYLAPKARGEHYRLGLINIYPTGIEKIQIQEVLLEGRESPTITDQLYFVKWVASNLPAQAKGYEVRCSRQEAGGIYYDAEFTCGGFTLKAPKIQVKEGANRVKVNVLAKVKTL